MLFVFLIELIGAILLTMRFMLEMNFAKALWFGVFHSISAFNNAGFSIFESGLTPYKHDLAINIIITSLIIIGGLGYFVLVELYFFQKKRIQNLSLHTKVVILATISLIVFSTLIIFLLEYSNPNSIGNFSIFDKILSSYFTAINYRTAGFNTLDMSALHKRVCFLALYLWLLAAHLAGRLAE